MSQNEAIWATVQRLLNDNSLISRPPWALLGSLFLLQDRYLIQIWCWGTVEPRNSVLQNSRKPRFSAKFLNDQIFTFELLNLQNSGKPRNSGRILDDQTFRYCGVLLYFITLKWPDFQRSTISLKPIILIKTAKESHSAINNNFFGTFKVKIGQLYISQSMFTFSWKLRF